MVISLRVGNLESKVESRGACKGNEIFLASNLYQAMNYFKHKPQPSIFHLHVGYAGGVGEVVCGKAGFPILDHLMSVICDLIH